MFKHRVLTIDQYQELRRTSYLYFQNGVVEEYYYLSDNGMIYYQRYHDRLLTHVCQFSDTFDLDSLRIRVRVKGYDA